MQFHYTAGAYWASNSTTEAELTLSHSQLLSLARNAPSAMASLHLKLVTALRSGTPGNTTRVTEADVPPCAVSLEYERCRRIGDMEAVQRDPRCSSAAPPSVQREYRH